MRKQYPCKLVVITYESACFTPLPTMYVWADDKETVGRRRPAAGLNQHSYRENDREPPKQDHT